MIGMIILWQKFYGELAVSEKNKEFTVE